MKVKTKVTFREYIKLLYSLAYERAIMKLLVCVAILILLWIIFYYAGVFSLPKPIIYQYITLLLIAVVQPTVIYITIRRNYNSSNHLRETLQMEITKKEIKIEGESFYLEVKWQKMFKIVEKPNWFLLYQNNLSAIIIPKNDLPANGINNFREILKGVENVPVDLIDS